jgi:hypothetical protein
VDEADFWVALEFRVSGEFAGMPERRYRHFWCDGFIPSDYFLDGPEPIITGRAWICNGPKQANWEFVLFLPSAVRSREEIDWGSLLPPEKMTKWMCFDEARRYIELEPAAAVPDLK